MKMYRYIKINLTNGGVSRYEKSRGRHRRWGKKWVEGKAWDDAMLHLQRKTGRQARNVFEASWNERVDE